MRNILTIQKTTIIIDILILLLGAIGIYNISNKAGLPIILKLEKNNLIITDPGRIDYNLKKGDIILSLDGKKIQTIEETEIYLDGKKINEQITLEIRREQQALKFTLITVNYYSTFYTIVALIVGLMFILVGVIVFLKCDIKLTAYVLHWALVFTAMIILMTWGNYSQPNHFFGLSTRIGFHFGYLFAPVFFLWFVTLFPKEIEYNTKQILQVLFTLSTILFIALNYSFILYTKSEEISQMREYIVLFDIGSFFLLIVALSAILIFIIRYIRSSSEIERKKIRWILLGFILGPLIYFLFWVIPSRIWNNPILPEPIVLLLVSFVPITFGIAIIKYRILNIDIIFKRGIIYSVVITILIIIYLSITTLFLKLLDKSQIDISSILSAVFIALLFQPIKTKVRHFVDKKFFHVEYDYRLSVNSFLTEIKDIYKKDTLINRSIEFINGIIPITKIGFFSFHERSLQLIHNINFEKTPTIYKEIFEENELESYSSPMGKQELVESEARIHEIPNVFSDFGASLIFILNSSKKIPHGLLILGSKKSDSKFTIEDIDLLNVISTRLSILLDRISLQEEIIREHLETERLAELNKLKSYFVSSVSHDLKTPLTSIKMFAERLKLANKLSQKIEKNYLEIIEGESNRLTRLIDNILDYAQIEAGVQKYVFKKTNLIDLLKGVLCSMEYQLKMNKFEVKTDFRSREIFVKVDADAVTQALVNIISNSIKYHKDKKKIEIRARSFDNKAIIELKDWGIGISKEEINNIFIPFFRSEKIKMEKREGVGLGLTIVKHIMDAHKAKVEVNSTVGSGTIVCLHFSQEDKDEKNINN